MLGGSREEIPLVKTVTTRTKVGMGALQFLQQYHRQLEDFKVQVELAV